MLGWGKENCNGTAALATGGAQSGLQGTSLSPDSCGRSWDLIPRAVGSLGGCEPEREVLVTGRALPAAHRLELGGGGDRPVQPPTPRAYCSDHPTVWPSARGKPEAAARPPPRRPPPQSGGGGWSWF